MQIVSAVLMLVGTHAKQHTGGWAAFLTVGMGEVLTTCLPST